MLSNQARSQTDHEREGEYGGVINLSNRNLKMIECLPKGISPYTLLLSGNLISKVENLQYFIHLQQLSLASNHIVDMKGVSAATGLRVLDLSNNSIITIEGVSSLRNLEWLNLSGNSVERIENLDRNTNLNHLDLSDNSIAVVSGFKTLKKLKTLLLHGNMISSLAVIKEEVSRTVCTLSLADNDISDLNEMLYLSSLTNLEQLSLLNNPCVLNSGSWRIEVNYRPYLAYCCKNLRNLDGHLVNNEERILGRLLDQAFSRIGHPSLGQHVQLVSILHHICLESQDGSQTAGADTGDDWDCNKLLESESFYIPVPSSDEDQAESDDPIMTEEEAIRLFSLAATIIQAHVRGYLVRKKFDFCQYRRREYAAACIQAAWKGYLARTRDIKVVNIRNELRIRRLISLINNLYSALNREHEEAVKSQEQFKIALKYLWQKILEQSKLNQKQQHKEQVKAAVKIQAWWRGCSVKKAFPNKSVSSDRVSALFALCHKLQSQLDVVTSQINEITRGNKRDKASQHEANQTDSEGQDQLFDTLGQQDSSQDDGETNYTDTRTCSSTVQHSDARSVPSTALPVGHEREEAGEMESSESNIPVSVELESEGKLTSVPFDPKVNKIAPSAVKLDHEGFGVASSISGQTESGLNTETPSTDVEEDIRHSSTVVAEEGQPSFPPKRIENDNEEPSERGSNFAHNEGDFQIESRFSSSRGQDKPYYETVSSEPNVQSNQLEEKTALYVGPHESDLDSQDSQESELTEKSPNRVAPAEETLQVGIPEIIVSSPVPTDDEGSDESDTSDIQSEVRRNKSERPEAADNHSHVDSSRKFSSSVQAKKFDQKPSEGDTGTKEAKGNTSFRMEGDLLEKFYGNNQETVKSVAHSLRFVESSSEKPGEEAVVAAQTSSSVFEGSASSLGERATNLLSQLRSEIASMKTARLSSASPTTSSDNDADTTKVENTEQGNLDSGHANTSSVGVTLQQHDTALERRDTSQSEPVSAVTYRLPLFEDVDSTCTSLCLDDFLSDPVLEEAVESPVSESGCKLKGTNE